MNLVEFVDKHGSRHHGSGLLNLGPASDAVFGFLNDEVRAMALLGTNFWRQWLLSDEANQLAAQLRGAPSLRGTRTVVVPRPDRGRVDLVVFDPLFPPGLNPVLRELRPTPAALRQGYARLTPEERIPGALTDLELRAALEVAASKSTAVILAREPRWERLALPSRAQEVAAAPEQSTAGVLVRGRKKPGVEGVTAALHAIPSGAAITVDGERASLYRADPVTDSAFLEVNLTPPPFQSPVCGLLKAMTPRGRQAASFVGLTSPSGTTTITHWDPQVPSPSRHCQARVYTSRDAQPGDSGAALLADDGWIVGFLFERTLPGDQPEECSWIWASSVMDALDVELI